MERTTDKVVRPPLRKYLSDYYTSSYLYEEVAIHGGKTIIDMMVVSQGEIIGFEIKSGRDNLRRLERQVASYDRVFTRNYIVVDDNHLERVEKSVPRYWGIFLAYDGGDGVVIELYRDAEVNPKQAKRWVLDFLWKDETTFLLKKYGVYKGMSKERLVRRYMKLGATLDIDQIIGELYRILPARSNWKESMIHE